MPRYVVRGGVREIPVTYTMICSYAFDVRTCQSMRMSVGVRCYFKADMSHELRFPVTSWLKRYIVSRRLEKAPRPACSASLPALRALALEHVITLSKQRVPYRVLIFETDLIRVMLDFG